MFRGYFTPTASPLVYYTGFSQSDSEETPKPLLIDLVLTNTKENKEKYFVAKYLPGQKYDILLTFDQAQDLGLDVFSDEFVWELDHKEKGLYEFHFAIKYTINLSAAIPMKPFDSKNKEIDMFEAIGVYLGVELPIGDFE